jgi:poly(3-hydroxybutyrate) depolymerase
VVGETTHATWPITQSRSDGSEIRRTYTVHVPPQHQDGHRPPPPIVFDLHVALSSGFQQDIESRMSTKGKEEGFIVAQPDSWPWWAASPIEESLRGGISDVEYFKLLLDTFDEKLCFDRNRIFVVSGRYAGWMSAALACASAKGELDGRRHRYRIAAAATVSSFPLPEVKGPPWDLQSSDPLAGVEICRALERDPVPLLVIVSDNDLTVGGVVDDALAPAAAPAAAQPIGPLDIARPAISKLVGREEGAEHGPYRVLDDRARTPAETVLKLACGLSALWAKENGCELLGLVGFWRCNRLKSPTASSPVSAWGVQKERIDASCSNTRAGVRFVAVAAGSYERNGHVWPGGLAGGDMSATNTVWDFFKQHPR